MVASINVNNVKNVNVPIALRVGPVDQETIDIAISMITDMLQTPTELSEHNGATDGSYTMFHLTPTWARSIVVAVPSGEIAFDRRIAFVPWGNAAAMRANVARLGNLINETCEETNTL